MTQKGHILEWADKSTDLFPERSLGISSCGIVRLLTHLAMLIGSNTNINVSTRISFLLIDTNRVYTTLTS